MSSSGSSRLTLGSSGSRSHCVGSSTASAGGKIGTSDVAVEYQENLCMNQRAFHNGCTSCQSGKRKCVGKELVQQAYGVRISKHTKLAISEDIQQVVSQSSNMART